MTKPTTLSTKKGRAASAARPSVAFRYQPSECSSNPLLDRTQYATMNSLSNRSAIRSQLRDSSIASFLPIRDLGAQQLDDRRDSFLQG